MIHPELVKALNDQMAFEFYSAYLYLGLAARMEALRMAGMACWLEKQSEDELGHARIFYRYLVDHGKIPELGDIARPAFDADSPLAVFQEVLTHEKKVTGRIDSLALLSVKNSNYAVLHFLNQFLQEQEEEERTVQLILDRLALAGNSGDALLILNADLGKCGLSAEK